MWCLILFSVSFFHLLGYSVTVCGVVFGVRWGASPLCVRAHSSNRASLLSSRVWPTYWGHTAVWLLRCLHLLSLSPWLFVMLLDYSWTVQGLVVFYSLAPTSVAPHPAIFGPLFPSKEQKGRGEKKSKRCCVPQEHKLRQAGWTSQKNSSHAIVACQRYSECWVWWTRPTCSVFAFVYQYVSMGDFLACTLSWTLSVPHLLTALEMPFTLKI